VSKSHARFTAGSSPGALDWGDLLERFKEGDREATERLSGIVLTFLARFGAFERRDSCDDIAQEVLVKLWRNLDRIQDVNRLMGWLRTTTHNAFVSWCRKHSVEVPSGELPEPEPDPDSGGLTVAELTALRGALGRLSSVERAVIEAIYLKGSSFLEAAVELGLPEGTLRTVRTQAMKRLRRDLLAGA
jgi:RNA polymerase sigma-70 factor (ECF subfamily)